MSGLIKKDLLRNLTAATLPVDSEDAIPLRQNGIFKSLSFDEIRDEAALGAVAAQLAAEHAQLLTENARDASFVTGPKHPTEAVGRGLVANGVAFLVQGAGEIAALEYRRIDADTSKRIATYPSSKAVDARALAVVGKNLINIHANGVAMGFFPSNTTGALIANADYGTTDFVPVTAGATYTLSRRHYLAWYDQYEVFISGTSSAITDLVLTAPAGAVYVRLSFNVTTPAAPNSYWAKAQLELGAVSTPWEAFSRYIVIEQVKARDITGEKLALGAVSPTETSFLALGKNLFVKQLVTSGYLINATTGTLLASASYVTSPLIAVTPGAHYYARGATKGIRTSAYFTAAGAVVAGGINDATGLTYAFTPPAGAVFVRISPYLADIDSFQVELGAAQTSFQAAGYYPVTPAGGVPVYLGAASSVAAAWTDKAWAGLGDSITAQAMWQGYVITALGLIYTNFGIAGTRLSGTAADAMWQNARINAVPTTIDVLTLAAGTNDWAQNVALGAVDSIDTNTFNGAFNSFATKAMARWPAKRIIVQTTPYGEFINFAARSWPNAYTNTLGLTPRDYAESIRVQCKRWGFPCADVAQNAGWNALNIATYLTNDGDYLHPNSTGGRRMAEVHIGVMRSIEPIA